MYRFAVIVLIAINENDVVQKNATKKGTGKELREREMKKGNATKKVNGVTDRDRVQFRFCHQFLFPFPRACFPY